MHGREFVILLNFIFSFIYLLFGFFVLLKNKKSATNKLFAYLCLSIFFWAMGTWLYQKAPAESCFFWARLDYAFATFMGTSLLLFAITFPSERLTISFKKIFLIFLPNFFIFFITLLPGGLIREIIYSREQANMIVFNSKFFPIYAIYYLLYLGIANLIFLKRYLSSTGELKSQMFYLILGILPPTIVGLMVNLIFVSPWINNFDYDWLGPLWPILIPIFFSWAIFKHHLMNVRVMATELFAGFVSMIFLIQLIMSEGVVEFILRFFLFFLVLLFSLLLVRGVLREIEELKKIAQMKSEFISIASHQLRSPLTAIKGYVSLMLEDSFGKIDDKAKEVLKKIYFSNERLIKLIGDLLDISLTDLGKMEFKFKEFSLENLILDIIEELEIKTREKNLYLNFFKPQEPLPKVFGDPDKLRQAILNIIDNAIKYTEKGGIKVKLKINKKPGIKAKLGDRSETLIVEVSDTGIGIEKDRVQSIFDGFNRGPRVPQIHTEGVGLGLTIAKRIIEANNGRVWAESEGKGKGSTFYIELPVSPK